MLGISAFLYGGSIVFDRPEVSDLNVDFWGVLVPLAVAMSIFGAVIAYSLGRTMLTQQSAGVDEMIGLVGRCESAIPAGDGAAGKGKVFVRGEYWNCTAETPVEVGDPVEIVRIDGLTLRVRPASTASGAADESAGAEA